MTDQKAKALNDAMDDLMTPMSDQQLRAIIQADSLTAQAGQLYCTPQAYHARHLLGLRSTVRQWMTAA